MINAQRRSNRSAITASFDIFQSQTCAVQCTHHIINASMLDDLQFVKSLQQHISCPLCAHSMLHADSTSRQRMVHMSSQKVQSGLDVTFTPPTTLFFLFSFFFFLFFCSLQKAKPPSSERCSCSQMSAYSLWQVHVEPARHALCVHLFSINNNINICFKAWCAPGPLE